MTSWLESLKIAAIFLTIAELILHLVPGTEYEKYVRYLLDLCVIVVLFWPLLNESSREQMTESIVGMIDLDGELWTSEETFTTQIFPIENPENVLAIIQTYEEENKMEGSVSDGEVMETITGE